MFKNLKVTDFNHIVFDDGSVLVQLTRHPFDIVETQEGVERAVEKIYGLHANLEFRLWKLRIRRYRILDSAGNGTAHIHIKWGF